MNDILTSQHILERLQADAEAAARTERRLKTLSRLKVACDIIASGEFRLLMKDAFGNDYGARHDISISAGNVEKVVKAKAALGELEWTGPTRVYIATDSGLREYVKAREDERKKPVPRPRLRSVRQKALEDALASIKDVELRLLVRNEIEEGRTVRRQMSILTQGLLAIPDIDVEEILNPAAVSSRARVKNDGSETDMTPDDKKTLRDFIHRMWDKDEITRIGFEIEGLRLRQTSVPRTTLIKPAEMKALLKLTGLSEKYPAKEQGPG